MSKFSERLKKLRISKKLTQQEIADKMNVNRVTYTNWENGKREPEIDKIVELSAILNTTIDYLMGKEDENLLDLSKEDIRHRNPKEREEAQKALLKQVEDIFNIGQNKFNLTDEEMDTLKIIVLNKFLKENDDIGKI